ncbi:PilZ domain-containing protein, partial [Anaeromusa sp.]|uniref:PilZ domain-containing protein n=1 Tax=Anaeromusa sp. TaxID=1872520 RepID=UPI002618AEB3
EYHNMIDKEENMQMDYHEKRVWGRISVVQQVRLRAERNLKKTYLALAIDVSEESVGLETEAKLALGEYIQLELEAGDKTVTVQAVVKRNIGKNYGCKFLEADYGKVFQQYRAQFPDHAYDEE